MALFPQLKDDFTRNVLTLVSGSVAAQALTVIVAPLLTYYYLPEDMAVAEMYIRIALLLAVTATARYEMAIVLPKEQEESRSILKLCLRITLVAAGLSFLLVLIGGQYLADALQLPSLGNYLYILPLSVLVAGGFQTLNYWQIRNKYFRNISAASVSSSLVNNGVKLSMGVASAFGPLGLILGHLFSQLTSLLIFLKKSLGELRAPMSESEAISLRSVAKKHKDFPIINMPHAFLDAIRELVIFGIILYYFGGVTMGIFAFVVRILKMPIALVGGSMSQVFFQEASEKISNNEDIIPIVKRTLFPLIKLGLPALLLFMYFGDDVIRWVFSEEWASAGIYAQILAPWIFINFLAYPISQIPIIVGKQKEVFLLSLIGFFTSVAALVAGNTLFEEPVQTFMLFSAVQATYLTVVIIWITSIAQKAKSTIG